jgi:hypothetical protein
MKPGDRRKAGRGGIELVEEAVHLLRLHAGATLPAYYAGSLPFILGLLYFWAEMSRSPFGAQHLARESLGMALLFLWMKFWQAIFVDGLRARISTNPPTRWNPRRLFRVMVIQCAIQPSGVVALPLSLLPAGLPFPWVYAFYQNVSALTDGESAEIQKTFKRAWRQMAVWPMQNHVILITLAGFGLCVLLNLISVCAVLPHLLKMLLGIESVYTRSIASLFNTTFLAAMFGLAYLCVDPIVKAVYLLRCFYGESLESGEDLKAELRGFAPPARVAAVGLVVMLSLALQVHVFAVEDSPAPPTLSEPGKATPAASIPSGSLDKAINEVIQQRKYAWRMPREKIAPDEARENAVVRFIKAAFKTVFGWIRDAIEWVVELFRKIFGSLPSSRSSGKSGSGWMTTLQLLCFVLVALVTCALVLLLLRAWQRRRREPAVVASEAIAPVPDLADENVGADELPEDGWLKLGRELLGRGELRQALRAFYFASLAHLATRHLLSIAKFKSNRDYERELSRRGHSLPDLLAVFGENVSVFDRSWYGMHVVDRQMVDRFLANVERITAA